MKIRNSVANLIYTTLGCSINKLFCDKFFDFIEDKIPREFLYRNISDLGCGDGYGTEMIKEIFKARSITGYEIVETQVKRAKRRGLKVKVIDLNKDVPKGEMVTAWFMLHHLKDKESTLKKIKNNFDYLVIVESVKSFIHNFDGGKPLPKEEWINLFDRVLGRYRMFQYKDGSLFIFWKKE